MQYRLEGLMMHLLQEKDGRNARDPATAEGNWKWTLA